MNMDRITEQAPADNGVVFSMNTWLWDSDHESWDDYDSFDEDLWS